MRIEILEFIYDGKIILGVFIILALLTYFIKDREKFVKYSITLNAFFIAIFLVMVIIERVIEYTSFEAVEPIISLEWCSEMMYMHSDKFIGVLIYFAINLSLIFKKLALNNTQAHSPHNKTF